MSLLIFNKIEHIEIDVMKMNNIVLFHVLYVVEIEYELVDIITVKHNIEGIVNEISVNYNLKGAVETVAEPPHIGFPIDFVKVLIIHVKLLFKFESNVVRNQSVKEFRQNNESVLISLRKQDDDVSITDLIQQCFMYHVCERDPI